MALLPGEILLAPCLLDASFPEYVKTLEEVV
jgi:hypothetical protein